MWCTRWFLPLIILPLPTAPPYFLLVFLLSLTLHARPCFYCMVLLGALFASSCYWQPLNLDASLTYPIAGALTFRDALYSSLNRTGTEEGVLALLNTTIGVNADANGSYSTSLTTPGTGGSYSSLTSSNIPKVVLAPDVDVDAQVLADLQAGNSKGVQLQLLDRCWCGFGYGLGSIFNPIDVSRWEMASVERLRRELRMTERRKMELKAMAEIPGEAGSEGDAGSGTGASGGDVEEKQGALRSSRRMLEKLARWGGVVRNLVPWPQDDSSSSSSPNGDRGTTVRLQFTESGSQAGAVHEGPASGEGTPEKAEAEARLPLLRREYNLKPYGLDITVDFGWGRDSSG